MAAQTSRVTDYRYLNWIKDTLALIYLKEGLEVFVDCQSACFHEQLKAALGNQTCSECTWQDLSKGKGSWKINCRTGVCQLWLDLITFHHKYRPLPVLATQNTDPKLWTTNAWEVMKLYQAKGSQGQHSVKDTDVAGILTVIGNCDYFHRFINDMNLVHKIQCIRNRTMHSSDFLVETVDLVSDLQTMLQFLRDLKSLSSDEQSSVQTAIDKIDELRVANLNVRLSREVELTALKTKLLVLETRINNVEGLENKHDLELHTLRQGQDYLLDVINIIRNEMITHQSTDLIRTRLSSLQKQFVNLEEDVSNIKQTTQDHGDNITTLYQRQTYMDMKRQAHGDQLTDIKGRLETVERHQNQAGSVNKNISDKDITALQEFLRTYYRKMRLKVSNPVVSEELQLDCFYVDPDIKVLRQTTYPGHGLVNVQDQPTPANASQCRQLFYTNGYKCRQIYITGYAGLGKSMFCKRLVDLWCKAGYRKSEISTINVMNKFALMFQSKQKKRMQDDMKILSEFKLLFHITLRESPNLYHVEDMIDSQILQYNQESQHLKASVLLKKVPCLVIVDGLDEWVCPTDTKLPPFVKPGIPGRDWLNENNVFLTTTRSWKFEVLQLTSTEVDKHVELLGFNDTSSKILCSRIIKLLERAERVPLTKDTFQTELQEKGLSHLQNIPVILTQLVCLWFDQQDLSQSQVQLYCSMLEMLLKRADKNLPEQTCTSRLDNALKEMLLPDCFSNCQLCQVHQHLLVNLCKVAFGALFSPKREHALIFESSQMEIMGVDQNNIDMCLKSGILSQRKVLGKWSVSEKKMSFLHKKLQEFLAALFLANCENAESARSYVQQFCDSVDSILEMSQVWMFVSGITPDLAKQLLTDLMIDVVFKNASLQQYRRTLILYDYPSLARSLQTYTVECVVEAACNDYLDLYIPLEDFVIDKRSFSTYLESLLTFNKGTVKYVHIYTRDMPRETIHRLLSQLQETSCLQKLHLDDLTSVITNMQPLCETLENNKNSLTCLELRYVKMNAILSDAVCTALNHISALELYSVTLTHEQIEHVFASVSQARQVKQLRLSWLYCSDHRRSCRPGIYLTGHTQLQLLILNYMDVNFLPTVTQDLKHIYLNHVIIAERALRQFMHDLSSSTTSHSLTVKLLAVTVSEGGENPVDITCLKHNDRLVVTKYKYDKQQKTVDIDVQTRQQMAI